MQDRFLYLKSFLKCTIKSYCSGLYGCKGIPQIP
jgi:hypothetical protein